MGSEYFFIDWIAQYLSTSSSYVGVVHTYGYHAIV